MPGDENSQKQKPHPLEEKGGAPAWLLRGETLELEADASLESEGRAAGSKLIERSVAGRIGGRGDGRQ